MDNKNSIAYLIGKSIYLRLICKEDINKKYLSWLNDRDVTKYIETGIFPTSLEDLKSFYKKISKSKIDVMFAIVTKKGNKHIGNIKLGNINWVHRFAELGIMIGDKRYWGKGYGRESCRLVLEYALKRLNLNKVFLGVCVTHSSALKVYKKIGFKVEGRMRKMFNIDNRYIDKIIMGILREDFLRNYKKQIR